MYSFSWIIKLNHLRGKYVLCYSLVKMKVIRVYYFLLINPYKFMTVYSLFPSSLEDIKDHV